MDILGEIIENICYNNAVRYCKVSKNIIKKYNKNIDYYEKVVKK